jgi:large subunit ribosomal protein L35
MPKMKSRSSVKKRYRTTASGKLKRKKSFARHILTSKPRKRKRDLRRSSIVEPTHEKRLKIMLGDR